MSPCLVSQFAILCVHGPNVGSQISSIFRDFKTSSTRHSISLETAPEMNKFSWLSNIILYSTMKSKPSLKPPSILGVISETSTEISTDTLIENAHYFGYLAHQMSDAAHSRGAWNVLRSLSLTPCYWNVHFSPSLYWSLTMLAVFSAPFLHLWLLVNIC